MPIRKVPLQTLYGIDDLYVAVWAHRKDYNNKLEIHVLPLREQRKATSVREMLNGRWFLTRVFSYLDPSETGKSSLGIEQSWNAGVEVMPNCFS